MAAGIACVAIFGAYAVVRAQQAPEPPVELVRRTVQAEMGASSNEAKVMFMDRKEGARGSQTKLVVVTREAMAGMVIANNDQPLTTEQRQAEDARLAGLVADPEAIRKKQRSEREDSARITRIIQALPDAFLYEADGTEAGTQEIGRMGSQLVRLKFRPNPKYIPPTRVEQVLTGMQGVLLIDAEQHRIAKIDGTLNKEVAFGWGILGHLDKGGHFQVEQAEVINGDWEITRMRLEFTGKVLLVKSLNIKFNEVFSNYRSVAPNLSFAQGVELLKKHEAELAENQQKPQGDKSK
jgi:hypothetical protein